MNEKLIIIETLEQLENLKQYIIDKTYIALDCETTGTDKDSKIIGISLSAETDLGFYIILAYWDVETKTLKSTNLLDHIKEFLYNLNSKSLVMHNGIFDCAMIENNFQIKLIEYLHTDTLILAHLLDENRYNGLKELGALFFGEDAKKEQKLMKESVIKNGGKLTKKEYELYKADRYLIANYGAKDAILTIKLFWILLEQLFADKLDKFFYEDESMPLLRGPTYDLNTTGLRIEQNELLKLKSELEVDCLQTKAYIYKEINQYVLDKYPGTNKKTQFNIGSSSQLSWLLFEQLENDFVLLTKGGKDLCKQLKIRIPYSNKDKQLFITQIKELKNCTVGSKKIKDYWSYLSSDKNVLSKFSNKYQWVEKLLYLSQQETILNTYVIGIQERLKYGIINPSFLQHGTTSGRYSSKNPNFQNLPRTDKRIKRCVIARPTKVFVGADYSQLEPRVFAFMSKDETLMNSFSKKEDFYAVVGVPIFGLKNVSLIKGEPNSFEVLYPKLRDQAKVIALATPYGRTASFTASQLNIKREAAQELMNKYFQEYNKVELMMLESHSEAKTRGVVNSLFDRPRRIPEAMQIEKIYGTTDHSELPYEARTLLNLAMNHKIQSTAASIMNRSAIRFKNLCKLANINVQLILQVHDELIAECDKNDADDVAFLLKEAMENTVKLPGVLLEAIPKISTNLADLK